MRYLADFVKKLDSVRRERMDDFTTKDVVEMLSLREHDKDFGHFRLSEFWANLGINMTRKVWRCRDGRHPVEYFPVSWCRRRY